MGNSFAEIFEVELKCWCYGITRVAEESSSKAGPKSVDRKVLHKVIQDFAAVLREAIDNLYAFDIIETARLFIEASKLNAPEREIAFYILAQLPVPSELSKEQVIVLHHIIQQLDEVYPGAFLRLEKKWKAAETIEVKRNAVYSISLERLSLPSRPKTLF